MPLLSPRCYSGRDCRETCRACTRCFAHPRSEILITEPRRHASPLQTHLPSSGAGPYLRTFGVKQIPNIRRYGPAPEQDDRLTEAKLNAYGSISKVALSVVNYCAVPSLSPSTFKHSDAIIRTFFHWSADARASTVHREALLGPLKRPNSRSSCSTIAFSSKDISPTRTFSRESKASSRSSKASSSADGSRTPCGSLSSDATHRR